MLFFLSTGQKIAEKFLEVLEGTCESAQLEIILNLPAIVDSQHHDLFAMPLRKLMNENRNLTNCILDAFTCLSLNEDALAEVHGSILKTLDSTPFYVSSLRVGLRRSSLFFFFCLYYGFATPLIFSRTSPL